MGAKDMMKGSLIHISEEDTTLANDLIEGNIGNRPVGNHIFYNDGRIP